MTLKRLGQPVMIELLHVLVCDVCGAFLQEAQAGHVNDLYPRVEIVIRGDSYEEDIREGLCCSLDCAAEWLRRQAEYSAGWKLSRSQEAEG
jgi:hypothetical protein